MRIVIDTNVVASAIFFGGRPKDLIELVVSKKLDAYASTEIITEWSGGDGSSRSTYSF